MAKGDLADGESYDSDEESDASCDARPHGLRDRYEKHCSESRHGEQQVEKTRHPIASDHGNELSPQPGQAIPSMLQVLLSAQDLETVAKYPFKPIPGASATGMLTKDPMRNVKMPADRVVAKNTAFVLIPVPTQHI